MIETATRHTFENRRNSSVKRMTFLANRLSIRVVPQRGTQVSVTVVTGEGKRAWNAAGSPPPYT